MIAANLIARGTEETIPACIKSLKQAGVDFLNITLNGAKQRNLIEDTCKEVDLPFKISEFDWNDDFAACRQYNLKQLPLGFEWYFWCDSDDIIEGDLKKAVEETEKQKADIAWFWYHYSFDEYDNVTNMFIRERLVRTKCLTTMEWKGMVHETLTGAEQFVNFTYEGVVIKHKPTEENLFTLSSMAPSAALIAANVGSHSTTYSVTGDGTVNIASINAALGAIEDKVNKISLVLAAFGFTA